MIFVLGMIGGILLLLYLVVGYFFMVVMEHKGSLLWLFFWPILWLYEYIQWRRYERDQSKYDR